MAEITTRVDDKSYANGVLQPADTHTFYHKGPNGETAYQIDMSNTTFYEEAAGLFELLAKYGKEISLTPPVIKGKVEVHKEVPKAPVLVGTRKITPSEKAQATGVLPKWVEHIRWVCPEDGHLLGDRNRSQHAKAKHSLTAPEIKWGIRGLPEGEEVYTCDSCGLPFAHIIKGDRHRPYCRGKVNTGS